MKHVYSFDEGRDKDRRLLGGKGAGLCEMTRLKLPVPPGFVITTEVCKKYYTNGKKLPKDVLRQVEKHVTRLEKKTGKKLNSKDNPLLVSVRSGAAISMPGMMDTILNLGLNDDTVSGLAEKSGNPRFAWDSYRRFIQLFGKVVFGIDDAKFENILKSAKDTQGVMSDGELNEQSLKSIVVQYKQICQNHTGRPFPADPLGQLELAIKAVFDSWMGERAIVYREKNNITTKIADGTGVNVVSMVFGNMGNDSATGVVFTRNPGDGTNKIFGEYLVNAQGEDVVAGTRTPKPVDLLKTEMPESYKRLVKTCKQLEKHYREPQDIEFTIEQGRFYLLQTRSAKMNAAAMIKTSVDMVRERLITRDRSLQRIQPGQLEQLLHRTIDQSAAGDAKPITSGIAASPGAAAGIAVFDVKRAVSMGDRGVNVILIREETKPEDVPAFFAAAGILTSRGGKTSHAAVVARGMGKPCIVGAADLKIDYNLKRCVSDGIVISEGDEITIDGATGDVFRGSMPTIEPSITDDLRTILDWSQKTAKLGIRANADTPEAAKLARNYGARGIGLCRTERMFNAADRIGLFVDMIMSETSTARNQSLESLGLLQRSDFVRILREMKGYPVTIRLLDPPLHEFLPNPEELSDKLRRLDANGSSSEADRARTVLARARDLAETNPMMGHRGVRVGVTYPEIYEMQIGAVFEAAADLAKEQIDARPQIMVPQVGSITELAHVKDIYDRVKSQMQKKHGRKLRINFGTMIEVVRAALTADELAETAEFFSFGTNDLTQATFSFSREDAEGKFLPEYLDKGLLETNPFQSIDAAGVGQLMTVGIKAGREARSNMEIGICGEHGGDPDSIRLCQRLGVSYVSASPHRIPIAIISAAQAALEQKTKPRKTKPKKTKLRKTKPKKTKPKSRKTKAAKKAR